MVKYSFKLFLSHLKRWGSPTCILRAQHIESKEHGCGEGGGLFFAGEVQPINLPRITPLVKSWRGLVILQTFHNGVVYNNLEEAKSGVTRCIFHCINMKTCVINNIIHNIIRNGMYFGNHKKKSLKPNQLTLEIKCH